MFKYAWPWKTLTSAIYVSILTFMPKLIYIVRLLCCAVFSFTINYTFLPTLQLSLLRSTTIRLCNMVLCSCFKNLKETVLLFAYFSSISAMTLFRHCVIYRYIYVSHSLFIPLCDIQIYIYVSHSLTIQLLMDIMPQRLILLSPNYDNFIPPFG